MRLNVGRYEVDLVEADCRVCHHERHGGFEIRTREMWSRLIANGHNRVVLDVGAYTGLYAIAAARAGCHVHAFEPLPNVAQRLVENVRRNMVHVTVHEAAAWCVADQMLPLRYNPRVALTSGASLVGKGDRTLKVLTTTIDAIGLPTVSAIKIDVERAETQVLEGAMRTIHRHRPAIIAECLDPEAGEEIRRMLPRYQCVEVMDDRNWYFLPL
jgi:FkbM family methyltransferase